MGRPVQFSLPRSTVHSGPEAVPRERRGFLSAVADAGASVELHDPHPAARRIRRAKRTLDDFGVAVGTVHGGHLQALTWGADGVSSALTQFRHLHLASVIDETPDASLEPAVSTHHAPRFWPDADVDFDAARQTFLSALDRALAHAEPDGSREHLGDAFDGERITATVALENVAPRGPHDYLLVTPGDALALERAAEFVGMDAPLAFTCDVGHAARPVALLDAMTDVRNVHLHSTVATGTPAAERIRERYGLSRSESVGPEDRAGVAHHLPPHVGDLDLPAVFDALDDAGYDGPLTVELHEPYRTADVVAETVDALDAYR